MYIIFFSVQALIYKSICSSYNIQCDQLIIDVNLVSSTL